MIPALIAPAPVPDAPAMVQPHKDAPAIEASAAASFRPAADLKTRVGIANALFTSRAYGPAAAEFQRVAAQAIQKGDRKATIAAGKGLLKTRDAASKAAAEAQDPQAQVQALLELAGVQRSCGERTQAMETLLKALRIGRTLDAATEEAVLRAISSQN